MPARFDPDDEPVADFFADVTNPADLYGRPLATSFQRRGGKRIVATHRRYDEQHIAECETPMLLELRLRLTQYLERRARDGLLTTEQCRLISEFVRRPELGLQGFADEIGVRRQAIHSRLKVVLRLVPTFRQVWVLKQTYIRQGRSHARNVDGENS